MSWLNYDLDAQTNVKRQDAQQLTVEEKLTESP
jgi:hypothetical protein